MPDSNKGGLLGKLKRLINAPRIGGNRGTMQSRRKYRRKKSKFPF